MVDCVFTCLLNYYFLCRSSRWQIIIIIRNNNALWVHWSQMFFFLSQYCIRMTNLLALVGLYCDLQNQNYMWRSCKNYVYNSTYISLLYIDTIFSIYDMIQCLGCTIILVYGGAYNHTCVYAYDENLLFDRHSDRLNEFFFFLVLLIK